MITSIVLPLDGSDLAARALPFASYLARALPAKLLLVRATLAHALPGVAPGPAQLAATDHAEVELDAMAAQLRAQGLAAEPHVYYDEAPAAIADAAQRHQAGLIVMSTHGRGGLGRWVFGSVADAVLRTAEVPVLLVPATCDLSWDTGPAEPERRIVVPLDGSGMAEQALGPACDLARALGARLLLVGVVEPPTYEYAEGYHYVPFDPEAELADVRSYLEGVAAGLRARGQPADMIAELGYVAAMVAAVAREQRAAAIVMATHGRSGLARVFLGSVATGVLHRANTPLLLVRPAAMRAAVKLQESATAAPKG